MNAPTHTPGPWNPSRGSGDQGLVISEATGATVAVAYDEKDTALLATAPELLEAARETLSYLESLPDANKGSVAEVGQCAVRYALRSAISKAERQSKTQHPSI